MFQLNPEVKIDVTFAPSSPTEQQEFTTVEAAHFLNVSRPFVIKEIEKGNLPHRMVGTHRRIAFEDLIDYGKKMREKQSAALARMAQNARDLGLDYYGGNARYTALLDACVIYPMA